MGASLGRWKLDWAEKYNYMRACVRACKRSMEVAGWKKGRTNEPQPEVPDFISSFLFDGTFNVDERTLITPIGFRTHWLPGCCFPDTVSHSSDVYILCTSRNQYR